MDDELKRRWDESRKGQATNRKGRAKKATWRGDKGYKNSGEKGGNSDKDSGTFTGYCQGCGKSSSENGKNNSMKCGEFIVQVLYK